MLDLRSDVVLPDETRTKGTMGDGRRKAWIDAAFAKSGTEWEELRARGVRKRGAER